jgi:anaerobic ribonucleoside-triphosphate reductase activating protein
MIKFVSSKVVFQEIPTETTLAFSLSGCKNNCEGCHSSFLAWDVGEELTTEIIDSKLSVFITCVLFLGGDDLVSLQKLIKHVKSKGIKAAVYSGKTSVPFLENLKDLDYLKLGPYIESRGPLSSKETNQVLYKRVEGSLVDITSKFWR